MTLIFFGSSQFSLHALRACLNNEQKVILIITTPPQKKGRGLQEFPTPVQSFAEAHRIPFIAPPGLKYPEILEQVQNLKPDLFMVSSYGKMIPSTWLKVPAQYALNVHPSLLPKYRGAAPIHWPVILGDAATGMSIAEVTRELDAGDLFYQKQIPIPPEADAETMTETLGKASQEALTEIFKNLNRGPLQRTAQNHDLTNYARKLTKDDGRVNWNRRAAELHQQIKGLVPWPRATFVYEGEPVQILKSTLISNTSPSSTPGEVVGLHSQTIHLQTGSGILALDKVKPSGKKEVSGGDFARGRRLTPGIIFPSDPAAPEFILKKASK